MIQQRRAYVCAHGPFEGSWHGVSGNHSGRIYDLSASGCFIEWPSQRPAGEPVRVQLKLPRTRLISVRGEVVSNTGQRWLRRTLLQPHYRKSRTPDTGRAGFAVIEASGQEGMGRRRPTPSSVFSVQCSVFTTPTCGLAK